MTDRDLGELIGTVRAMGERLAAMERTTHDGFARLQASVDARTGEISKRVGTLERWRAWMIGALAVIGVVYSAILALMASRFGSGLGGP